MKSVTKSVTLYSLALFIAAGGSAAAYDYKVGSIEITRPWSPATAKGAPVAAGYLKLSNTGTVPDRLIGGSLAVAGRFEVHEMATTDGVMRMRPLTGGLEIKPGETVELKPGSYHVMFVDLNRQLHQGERVKGMLKFEKAGSVEVEFAVDAMGGPANHAH